MVFLEPRTVHRPSEASTHQELLLFLANFRHGHLLSLDGPCIQASSHAARSHVDHGAGAGHSDYSSTTDRLALSFVYPKEPQDTFSQKTFT